MLKSGGNGCKTKKQLRGRPRVAFPARIIIRRFGLVPWGRGLVTQAQACAHWNLAAGVQLPC